MEGTNLFVLFVVGFVLGCTLVMLLWMSSPGCVSLPEWAGGGVQAGTSANLSSAGGTSSTVVIRDEGGRTLATTGQRGTPSVFTDERGNARNLVCYMSYYCVDETPCEDTCDDDECVDYGKMCGYWPGQTSTLAANMPSEGRDYGECCPPYECAQGYCGNEQGCVPTGEKCAYDNDCCEGQCMNGICTQEGCQQQYDMCGIVYPTQTATTAYNPNPVDYGDCCPPYECVNNKCEGEEQCVETGQTCGTTYPTQTATAYNPNPVYHGECCPPDECVNNVCTSEEPCVETDALCGYGPPAYTTAAPANRTWHGSCCAGDTCVDGYCQPQCAEMGSKCSSTLACCEGYCVSGVCAACTPSGYTCSKDSDCCTGYSCQNGKCAATCIKVGSKCGKDSECCSDFCDDGVCREEPLCGEEGQTCGLQVECCSGLECSDNDICVECAPVGDECGQYAGGIGCCSNAYCYNGQCQQKTKYLCTDTESGGPNYYTAGSATGVYQGDYGTYTDYCLTSASGVVDYYCEVNGEYSQIQSAQVTCPNGCTNGACN